jgi:DMSO/TMAO reductase YedYZ heme-binding membrane subunit
MQTKKKRTLSLRLKRHALLAAVVLVLVTSFYFLLGFSPERWVDIPDRKAEMPLWRLSMSLAYNAFLFLSLTLSIGPYRAICRLPVPTNYMLRRDIAYWAGGLALAHISASIWIHTDGWALWGLYFWIFPNAEYPLPLHRDMFGFANLAGTAVAAIIVILLIISNNAALKRLKPKNWKNLQRLSYVAFFLAGLHGMAYQIVEHRLLGLRVVFFIAVGLVIVLQLLGLATRLADQHEKARMERRTETT